MSQLATKLKRVDKNFAKHDILQAAGRLRDFRQTLATVEERLHLVCSIYDFVVIRLSARQNLPRSNPERPHIGFVGEVLKQISVVFVALRTYHRAVVAKALRRQPLYG